MCDQNENFCHLPDLDSAVVIAVAAVLVISSAELSVVSTGSMIINSAFAVVPEIGSTSTGLTMPELESPIASAGLMIAGIDSPNGAGAIDELELIDDRLQHMRVGL